MPWKECHVMDERLRFVARLLEGEKMAPLCAEFDRLFWFSCAADAPSGRSYVQSHVGRHTCCVRGSVASAVWLCPVRRM